MPTPQVSKSHFKAHALELMREVEASGQSLIVTERGQPKLEVRPYREDARSPLDILRGTVKHYDRPTDPVADDDWESA
ncbi:type II toxin-antitoxin system Phd/YefM family antitoxin [Andreprevotia chitinilytica]|uniref:type II toxin-antitoxin system Phd/YefM family antitoxin n=1 Tax=Andreprevotia chitinilytica TaxID=396808 RepID=UPI00054D03F2|nr:prevent-host-death protein [Andreprevotia chitinilytica]